MKGFDEIDQLREEYERAVDLSDQRRTAYHAAIRRLYASGVPLREIAARLGLSHQRVHQIVGVQPQRRRRRGAGIAGAVLLFVGVAGAATIAFTWDVLGHRAVLFRSPPSEAEDDEDDELPRCEDHPCAGWRYHVLYREADGSIVASSGCNGCPPEPFVPALDEVQVDVTGNPLVPVLVGGGNPSGYYVDLVSGEIMPRRTYRPALIAGFASLIVAGAAMLTYARLKSASSREPPALSSVSPPAVP